MQVYVYLIFYSRRQLLLLKELKNSRVFNSYDLFIVLIFEFQTVDDTITNTTTTSSNPLVEIA